MAVDMFIKIGDVVGEARDATYKEWIDVLAWSWGVSQSATMHQGGGGGGGKANVQDVSITKYTDTSSTDLWLKCATGKHYPEAKLICRKAGDTPVEYIKITMTDVIISSISTGGSGGEDRTTENITLNFAKYKIEYTPQDQTGAPGTTAETSFDVAQNVQV